ncbi:protein of unknown function [Maridesulfovibrio hydrothermalis AM13 = DSM 14728]|uniref:Uncharacterized protein n=1 Tax=Maridesulfovibrio hydrothermalis AM13 = DSM 14728 TaxID=1121451 RepID=L0RAU4_9BACT|nr:protein of unknown function [Maridesulfovibrio hydrothermalis AM13 = DSM 14728]
MNRTPFCVNTVQKKSSELKSSEDFFFVRYNFPLRRSYSNNEVTQLSYSFGNDLKMLA